MSIRALVYFLSARRGTFVYKISGRVAGFFQICQFDRTRTAWLDLGAVDPDLKGSGISNEIYQALENICRESGHSDLRLAVDIDNRRAIRFYEKVGFSCVSESVSQSGGQLYFTKRLTSDVCSVMNEEIFRVDPSPGVFRKIGTGLLALFGIFGGVLEYGRVSPRIQASYQES